MTVIWDPLPCQDCGTETMSEDWFGHEYYMVHDCVWADAGMPILGEYHSGVGILCIGCLEKRLGRELTRRDFTTADVNTPMPWLSARLLDRLAR